VENPYFRTNLEAIGVTYELQNHPKWKDKFRKWSPLIEEEVSWWTYLPQNREDLSQMVRDVNMISGRKFCTLCMEPSIYAPTWAITYEIDKAKGTDYHNRFKNFMKYYQKNDLRFSIAVMDPKGDRSLRPSEQQDPDMHLMIVKKTKDGIVVKGCKSQVSDAPCVQLIFVIPCRDFRENEKEYAVSFITPSDTKGITYITRPAAGPLEKRKISNPVSSSFGHTESMAFFDDVFVPWENVFMCGEWEFTGKLVNYFANYQRGFKCSCTAGRTDIFVGAAALVAQYNGVEKASHVRSKLTDMMIASNIGYGCALSSMAEATDHPSGIQIPHVGLANAGFYQTRLSLQKFLGTLMELSGGVITTMPIEPDLIAAKTKDIIEKYLKGKSSVPAIDRIKALSLSQDLTASQFTGYLMSSIVCAAGTPETNRVEVFRTYDIKKKMEIAKALSTSSDALKIV
jgi:aromatic ring hydroxylase